MSPPTRHSVAQSKHRLVQQVGLAVGWVTGSQLALAALSPPGTIPQSQTKSGTTMHALVDGVAEWSTVSEVCETYAVACAVCMLSQPQACVPQARSSSLASELHDLQQSTVCVPTSGTAVPGRC